MDFDFGVLQPYMDDVMITDINFNGRDLWLDDLNRGRLVLYDLLDESAALLLCHRLSNLTNLPFNALHPVLETEFDDCRVSCLHPSISGTLSLSIRKTPKLMRMNRKELLRQRYVQKDALDFLETCVRNGCNMMVSGLPGSGKTELVKYLSQFIPPKQRVITIEDALELHFRDLHPHMDCVMIRLNEHFDYAQAIKASLRQRPNWVLVSEVRSTEVVYLLQSISTGASIMSTIHAPDARAIPSRLLQMFPQVELSNMTIRSVIHQAIDVGIHLERRVTDQGISRYIEEIVAYDTDAQEQPVMVTLYQAQEGFVKERLTHKVLQKIKKGQSG